MLYNIIFGPSLYDQDTPFSKGSKLHIAFATSKFHLRSGIFIIGKGFQSQLSKFLKLIINSCHDLKHHFKISQKAIYSVANFEELVYVKLPKASIFYSFIVYNSYTFSIFH